MRFQSWFPSSGDEFAPISTGTCNASLAAYEAAWKSSPDHWQTNLGAGKDTLLYQTCKQHASCILENTSEYLKSGLGTASVVLGLLPTILAVIAPSMSELALLSERRSLLAALLAIGAPGTLQTRVFSYEDPAEVLEGPNGLENRGLAAWIHTAGAKTGFVIGLVELIMVAFAVANTVILADQLENKSVLAWGCSRTWPVYVWVFVPFVIHGMAAVGYRLTLAKRDGAAERHGCAEVQAQGAGYEAQDGKMSEVTTSLSTASAPYDHTVLGSTAQRIRLELNSTTTASALCRPRHRANHHSLRMHMGVALNSFAGFLGFLHLLFGTVTFSGLLFIVNLDAVGSVFIRLLASCMVCRLVTMIEMTGLRREKRRWEEEKYMRAREDTAGEEREGKGGFVRTRVRC